MPATRRAFLGGALAGGLALATGCGVARPTTDLTLSREPVTLRFAWWGSDSRHESTQQAIDLFQQRHPRITVRGEFNDWSGYWSRLATTFAANDAPDVVQMDEQYLRTYTDRGALLDLETLDAHLDTSRFLPTSLATGRARGVLYGLPTGDTVLSLVTNVGLLRQYGIAVPDDTTWTWADLATLGREVAEASGGTVAGVNSIGDSPSMLHIWARQRGLALYDENGVTIPADVVAELWDYILELSRTGAMLSPARQAELFTATTGQAALVTGQAVAERFWNNQLQTLEAAMPDSELTLLAPPKTTPDGGTGSYIKASMFWSVAAGTRHPAESALLIDFLANDPEAVALFGTDRGIPANADVREQLRPELGETALRAVDYGERVGGAAEAPPASSPPGASQLEPIMQRYLSDVLFGRQLPRPAAEAFVEEITLAVDAARR